MQNKNGTNCLMSNFSDWQDRMLRAVWRHGENLSEEVVAWMVELYDEFGEISEDEFCELWTMRTFSMARSAFEVIQMSAFDEIGKRIAGEEFCYINYFRDPEFGPVGVVRFKSVEVSTPDLVEVLGVVAEGVQEFVMNYYVTVWPVCGRHAFGLHVDYFHEAAVWKCNGGVTGGHVVRAVDPSIRL
ncbi:hypothetical protein [Streptomyces sp. NBC_00554]|uniref:hypothetical protein n=1 Tax=unclassified Streptomyces TaxID=2593676 RepID=UPI00352D1A1C|nr:hypothetical protein OG256_19035 [Streptomyces sp. NBC_00564]WUC51598.1 hypothetical protein OG266_25800 [Streptomyces sp. NBC_00554]